MLWFQNWFYRPTEECKKLWTDSEYVSFTFWRFMWLKEKPEKFKHGWERDYETEECWMWAYKYIPIYKRLYWCEEWMGTNGNLFPWRAFISVFWIPFLVCFILMTAFVIGMLYR